MAEKGEDSKDQLDAKIGVSIPHYFWFDLIGRFVPGAYALSGWILLLVAYNPHTIWLHLRGLNTLQVLLIVSGFSAVSYFLGFFLGAASYLVFETLLRERPNVTEIAPAVSSWLSSHYKLKETNTKSASQICLNRVSHLSPGLGIIYGKRSGEALSSRSVLFASIVLLVAAWLRSEIAFVDPGTKVGPWLFFVVALAAFPSWWHYRRRNIEDPFLMLAAVEENFKEGPSMDQQPRPINIEKFNQFLTGITTMVEDYSIERAYLWALVLADGRISEVDLVDKLTMAKSDPEYRKRAKEQFADAWKALEDMGRSALFEVHLLDTPPTDKPN